MKCKLPPLTRSLVRTYYVSAVLDCIKKSKDKVDSDVLKYYIIRDELTLREQKFISSKCNGIKMVYPIRTTTILLAVHSGSFCLILYKNDQIFFLLKTWNYFTYYRVANSRPGYYCKSQLFPLIKVTLSRHQFPPK